MRTYNQHPTINPKWTNNNSESMNHILKLNNNWQFKPLADFINLIHTEITTQYLETTTSFINSGTYTLTEQYLNFKIPPCVWERKDATSCSRHMARFLTTTKARHQRDVESTDGQLVVRESAVVRKSTNLRDVVMQGLQQSNESSYNHYGVEYLCIYLYIFIYNFMKC